MIRRLLLTLFVFLSADSVAQSRPSVLVIESYHADYAWDQGYTEAIRERLAPIATLHFFEMDTKRRPPEDYPQRAEEAWARYQALRPDLVILGDDNALKLVGPKLAKTSTPVIYLGINNNPRHYFESLPANMTGVLERPLLARSILHIRRIMGDGCDKVLVLFDDGTTARAAVSEAFRGEKRQRLGSVTVQIQLIGELSAWREAVRSAADRGFDAIVVGLYHTLTDRGRSVPEEAVIHWTSEQTPVPLFAFWSFAVGERMTAGGLVLDGATQGRLAGEMAAQVLAGKHLSPMPRSSGQGVFLFSKAQLARWGIELPADIAEQARFLP